MTHLIDFMFQQLTYGGYGTYNRKDQGPSSRRAGRLSIYIWANRFPQALATVPTQLPWSDHRARTGLGWSKNTWWKAPKALQSYGKARVILGETDWDRLTPHASKGEKSYYESIISWRQALVSDPFYYRFKTSRK